VATSFVTISSCHPFFTIKTRVMSGLSLPSCHQLYAGYRINLACDVSNQAVAFFAFNFFSKVIMQGKKLSEVENFIGGLFAGAMAAPLLSSLERIMILQQVHIPSTSQQSKNSIFNLLKSIGREEGWRGYSRGLAPTFFRESINSACFFGLSQLIHPIAKKHLGDNAGACMLSYQVSGAIAGFLTTPFDLIKTRMQNHVGGHEGLVFHTQKIGMKNLFTGALARSGMISSTMMVMGLISTKIPTLFPNYLFERKHSDDSE